MYETFYPKTYTPICSAERKKAGIRNHHFRPLHRLSGTSPEKQSDRGNFGHRAEGRGLKELIPPLAGERIKNGWEKGEMADAPLMVGQSIGLIKEIMGCRELMESMAREAEETLRRVDRLVQA